MFDDQVTFEATITRSFLPRTGETFTSREKAVAHYEPIFRASLERYCWDTDAELLDIEEAEVPE
jgi:hypothetical protein